MALLTFAELNQEIRGLMEAVSTANAMRKEETDGLRARLDEFEQRMARGGGYTVSHSSLIGTAAGLGAAVAAHPELAALRGNSGAWRGRLRIPVAAAEMAAITTVTAGATRDVLVAPDRRPEIITPATRRFTVRSLLAPGTTTSNAISYTRETGFTNNADVVSEGELKPESDLDFELVTAPVATIAHFAVASKQILDDASQLQSYIDGRLRYGVSYREELQLLYGDGTGVNLHGLVPQATAYNPDPAISVGFFRPDDLLAAILQTELAELPATGIVLNPTDWRSMQNEKDLQARYVGAGPYQAGPNTCWSLPVVATPAMTAGRFLVGAFSLAAQIFDREEATVEISTEDSDNFRRNMISLRGEERLALAVYRPEALIYGEFSTGT